MNFVEKVKTALKNLKIYKVLLKGPVVGFDEVPWLVMDPLESAFVSLESRDMFFGF